MGAGCFGCPASSTTMLMLPIEAMNVLGSLAGIGEIAKATFGGGSGGGDGKAPPAPRRPTVPTTGAPS
jgi:hypothetical protein